MIMPYLFLLFIRMNLFYAFTNIKKLKYVLSAKNILVMNDLLTKS